MDSTLILAFVVSLCLPLLGSVFGWGVSERLGEKRTLARLPVLGTDPIKTVPDKFESFYTDHFGFRNGLIRSHNWLRYKFFKGATHGKVLFGKENWLFLAKAGTIADYLGQSPLTPDELSTWKERLERRREWLAQQGIRYLVVIAPNKLTIYPEMLPDHVGKFKGQTRMDQLAMYLSQNSTVELLDVRQAMREAKKTATVYHPTDTHWTDRGGYVTYIEICKRLAQWFPDIRPWPTEDFIIKIEKQPGDLGTMLGLGEQLTAECEVFKPRKKRNAYRVNYTLPPQHPWPGHINPNKQVAMENKNAKYRLLLYHDSFGTHGSLQEYLGEHFSRISFVPLNLDNDCLELIVEQERPDVVIQEIVERKLDEVPSPGPGL